MFNKYVKLNNGIEIKFSNINERYWSRIEAEFSVQECETNNDYDAHFQFSDDLNMANDQYTVFRGPVASDDEGVFFIDQSGKVARVSFETNSKTIFFFKIENGFDPHFFYIIVLYSGSLLFRQYGGVFIHSAIVRKAKEVLLFPAWRHAGKTHLALSLVGQGYELISDDGAWLDKCGNILPVSRNIHILYHNVKLNQDLASYLSQPDLELYELIKNIETGNYLISPKRLRYLQSKFRVRVPSKNVNQNTKAIVDNNCKVIFLLRDAFLQEPYKVEAVSSDISFKKMLSSSKFELAYMFDLYTLWKCKFGFELELFEEYETSYLKNLSSGLSPCSIFQQYSYNTFPRCQEIYF